MDKTKCTWTETDESWVTGCGKAFVVNNGAPIENEMLFCCFCGNPLKEKRTEELAWEGDDAAEPEEA